MVLVIAGIQAQSKVKVVCIGNSITQGASTTLNYPVILSGYLGIKYKVYNMGKSGTTLRFSLGAAWIKQTILIDSIKKIVPDIVTIKLGTNDAGGGLSIGPEYKADYLKLIDSVKKWSSPNVKIYLCLPIPVFKNATSDKVIDSVMIPIIKEIGIQKNLPVIDLNKPFDGHIEYVIDDGIHPSTEGFQLIAKTVFNAIKTPVTKVSVVVDNGGGPVITTSGGKIQLKAIVEPVDATTTVVNWTSENIDGVGIMNSLGGLTGKENGTVKAIATSIDSSKTSGELIITISNQTNSISFSDAGEVKVYPNPAHDMMYVTGLKLNREVEVYNFAGLKIWTATSSMNSLNIDVSRWEAGVYYISFPGLPGAQTIKVVKE